jgi:hypothetical protein
VATTSAIYAVSWVLKTYIENAYAMAMNRAAPTVSIRLPHEVTGGLSKQEGDGFTICLYRVSLQYSSRNSANRKDRAIAFRPSLPVDLHFLISPWAASATSQHQMLGWLLRALEDMGPLPAPIVNTWLPEPIFRDDEAVELSYESLPIADYFNLWDKLREKFPLSATYVARTVMLDSTVAIDEGPLVRTREFKFGRPPGAN